ncbi:MAG: PIG-L family deacetylase [Alphaproteobacteria bacterium]|nr:PIG-L family deacetylase [Alphaproteobacteria bacterium]
MEARRILLLAPHPDDEIVACGIAASRAGAAGARVCVLYLTTGVPAPEALWPWQRAGHAARVSRRRAEAHAAAALLELEAVRFLDCPSRQLRHHLDATAAEVERALAECAADALWVTAFEGAHQDHDAANALASRFRDRVSVCEFAAYNFAGGHVRSNHFPDRRGGDVTIELSAGEAALKKKALACYASERGNLRHVGVARESWRPLPRYDYGAPPHAGRLFRERFHWVPFRHPRVDFDRSAPVYEKVGGWVSARDAHAQLPFGNRPGGEPRQADGEFAGALDEAERQRGLGR